jgi:ketosteroid isomerase-like protein
MRPAVSCKIEFQKLFDGYVTSYREGDAAGCASCFVPAAELFSPYGPPTIGRSAIQAIHQEWVKEGAEDKTIVVVNAGASQDIGWCTAHYSEGATGNGTSLNILQRQRNGSWLITHCSLNAAP